MKRILSLLLFIPTLSFSQFTSIPDPYFEQALINLGHDNVIDGQVLTANINNIDSLNISQISNTSVHPGNSQAYLDLTGIEDFSALTYLDCSSNHLDTLDLSQNTNLAYLNCNSGFHYYSGTNAYLNVSNTPITHLLGAYNSLFGLDISNTPNLNYLDIDGHRLTSLDLTNNPLLTYLDCAASSNGLNWDCLTSLDLTNNPLLTFIDCSHNFFTSLDLGNKPHLTHLKSIIPPHPGGLISINISQCPNLTHLDLYGNHLTSIDLSNNTLLTNVRLFSNELTTLNISNSPFLDTLWCGGNDLTALDVSQNTNLLFLSCDWNDDIPFLDVSQCTSLIELYCNHNFISSMDLSQNTDLKILDCGWNQMVNLDISGCGVLEYLNCEYNDLTSLDVTVSSQLEELWCDNNDIMGLDFSYCPGIKQIHADWNQLTCLNLKNIDFNNFFAPNFGYNFSFFQWPQDSTSCVEVDDSVFVMQHFGPAAVGPIGVLNQMDFNQNVTFTSNCNFPSSCYVPYPTSQYTIIPDSLFELRLIGLGYDSIHDGYVLKSNIMNIDSLDISNFGIYDLTGIEDFINMTYLNCSANQIVNLDLSQNSALSYVDCSNNQINNLLFSQKKAQSTLKTLNCNQNQISTLDVASKTLLASLSCDNNLLTDLNISNGNNLNFSYFSAINNPNLSCITVDNSTWSANNWPNIDSHCFFSNDCSTVSVEAIYGSTSLSVYPNPTKESISVSVNNYSDNIQTEVFDLVGNQLLNTTKKTISLINFPSGIYLLKVAYGNRLDLVKVIKE